MPLNARSLTGRCEWIGIAVATVFCCACHAREPTLSGGQNAAGAGIQGSAVKQPRAASRFFEANIEPARRHEGRPAENVFAVRAAGEPPDHAIDLSFIVEIAGSVPGLPRERAWVERTGRGETLVLEQTTENAKIVLRTAMTLASDRPYLDIESTLRNSGPVALRDVHVGLRAEWPGRATFVPGLGFVRDGGSGQARWIARESTRFTYAVAFPERPEPLSFVTDHVGPVGVVAWSSTDAIDPGRSSTVHRVVVAVPGQLSDVATEIWKLLGIPAGIASGKLNPPPKWGTVDALDPSGHLVLRTSTATDGTWRLPLPLGAYRLVLRSPGGEDEVPLTIGESKEVGVDLLPPRAGHLRFSTEDETGKALPARWTFVGTGSTHNPDLGPEPTADANVVFSSRGDGSVELPEGTYRVVVTHGPEYSVFSQDVTVRRNQGAVMRAQLERRVDTSGWIACDFHLHAAPSFDSEVTLEQRVLSLISEGIEFAVATDHNVVTDYSPAARAVAAKGALATTPGVEVTTPDWGHFNVFPLAADDPPPPYRDASAAQIFSAVRQERPDALIQVNHPRMGDIGYFNRGDLDATASHPREGFSFDFDTIEVFNGFDLGNAANVTLNLESWYDLLNLGRRYTGVGNSDSHRLSVQWAGYPRTYVHVPNDDPAAVTSGDVVKGLKSGAVMVSNGPFVKVSIDGHSPGQTVSAKTHHVRVDARIETPGWLTVDRLSVIVNGSEAASQELAFPLNGRRLDVAIPIDVTQDAWVVVVVHGDSPMELVLPGKDAMPLAFSNPIYLDADGDGRVRMGPTESPITK